MSGLLLKIDLRVARNARGEIGGQGQSFIQRIGVQRLRMTQCRGQRLNTGADYVVVRILRGQAPARGLRMRAKGK